jgi:hypothetical protein
MFDPVSIAATLAALTRLAGAVAGAYATAAAGQELSDDQKASIDAAQAIAGYEQDQAVSDALNRAAGQAFPSVARRQGVPGPDRRVARADDTVGRAGDPDARPRRLSELRGQPDDLGPAAAKPGDEYKNEREIARDHTGRPPGDDAA